MYPRCARVICAYLYSTCKTDLCWFHTFPSGWEAHDRQQQLCVSWVVSSRKWTKWTESNMYSPVWAHVTNSLINFCKSLITKFTSKYNLAYKNRLLKPGRWFNGRPAGLHECEDCSLDPWYPCNKTRDVAAPIIPAVLGGRGGEFLGQAG